MVLGGLELGLGQRRRRGRRSGNEVVVEVVLAGLERRERGGQARKKERVEISAEREEALWLRSAKMQDLAAADVDERRRPE